LKDDLKCNAPRGTDFGLSRRARIPGTATLLCAAALLLASCEKKVQADPKAEAPPPAQVEKEGDSSVVKVDHPEQFPLVAAEAHQATPEMTATGVVNPDISRNVPVVSLASGRIVEIHARLGDTVTKGQLLLKVQSSDVSSAYSDYRKAVKNEQLTKIQLERANTLYARGAYAKSALEIAQNAEDNALVDIETTKEHLRVIGLDPEHPSGIVDIFAPISGVITDQQVTNAAGVQALNSTNPFTISDLSKIWIICDVFENKISFVRIGEYADIHLNAYPDRVLRGRISNIGPIMDPNIRTAKVRLELDNPGYLRIGMFVSATFHGLTAETHAVVPANAVLHLRDRDWVYVKAPNNQFKRLEVVGGNMLPDGKQEILSGLDPGMEVVSNALVLQNTVEQ
jgi:cobalt-zinc-cadmium efflux system membrane fusion protein